MLGPRGIGRCHYFNILGRHSDFQGRRSRGMEQQFVGFQDRRFRLVQLAGKPQPVCLIEPATCGERLGGRGPPHELRIEVIQLLHGLLLCRDLVVGRPKADFRNTDPYLVARHAELLVGDHWQEPVDRLCLLQSGRVIA